MRATYDGIDFVVDDRPRPPVQSAGPRYAARPLAMVLATALLMAGSDESPSDEGNAFYIRTLSVIEGVPTLRVMVGNTVVSSASHGAAAGFTAVHTVSQSLKIMLPTTDADADEFELSPKELPRFTNNTPYTLIAYGSATRPRMFFVEAWGQRDNVADDKVVLQFAHAAPGTPRLDVYVTTLEAELAVSRYVATLSLTEASVPLELTLARDRDDASTAAMMKAIVELRAAGSEQVLYKSGEIDLTERKRTLFAIADADGASDGRLRLVTVDGVVAGSRQR